MIISNTRKFAHMFDFSQEHSGSIRRSQAQTGTYRHTHNSTGNRRAAWRIIANVEQEEKTKALYEREYVWKVEDELRKICDGIVVLMDNNFIPLARAEESKGLDYKVKGEHARYLAKCATDDAANKACKMACVALEDASADPDKVVDVPGVTLQTPTVQTILLYWSFEFHSYGSWSRQPKSHSCRLLIR